MSKSIKCLFRINILVGVAIILLLSGSANAATSIWDESSGSPLPFTWNHRNFDDFNVSGVGTENLTILQTNLGTGTGKTRTIRSREDTAGAGLLYTTTRYFEEYEVSKNKNLNVMYALNNVGNTAPYGKYYAKINLFGEPYVGINGKANKLAKLVLEMGKEDKMTLTVGKTWEMGGGYTLTAQSIDARSTQDLHGSY